jgi:hypothetical protein
MSILGMSRNWRRRRKRRKGANKARFSHTHPKVPWGNTERWWHRSTLNSKYEITLGRNPQTPDL